MKRIGLYLRVSTDEQARIQDGSLVSQQKRIEEFVESQNRREPGWGEIVGVYCDEGRSAKDMRRPEFQKLLNDIRTGQVNLILATELSRLSRSIRDFCEIWDLFKRHNASFITLRDHFDTTTAAGEMMVFNLINYAQYERKQTAERIAANWASRAKRGLWNGGTIPLGFDRNPQNKGVLMINEREAEHVRMIFRTFLETESLRQTCLKLPEMGITTKAYTNQSGGSKGGTPFTVSGLNTFLKNRAYVGLREIGKKKGSKDVCPAAWPAIIDYETFDRVQKRLEANQNRYKPNDWKTYAYPLTEKVVCGECGKHLGGKSAHGHNRVHHYYAHSRKLQSDGVAHLKRCRMERVQAEHLEDLTFKSLKGLLTEPAKLDEMLAIYRQGKSSDLPGLEGRVKSTETEVRTTEKRIENLTLRLADLPPEISGTPFYDQLQSLQKRLTELERVLGDLKAQHRKVTALEIDEAGLKTRLTRIIRNLELAPAEDRRPLYSNVIDFVEIHAEKMRLGIFAPTKRNGEAATEGGSSFLSSNFELGAGKVAGSTTVLNGGA